MFGVSWVDVGSLTRGSRDIIRSGHTATLVAYYPCLRAAAISFESIQAHVLDGHTFGDSTHRRCADRIRTASGIHCLRIVKCGDCLWMTSPFCRRFSPR